MIVTYSNYTTSEEKKKKNRRTQQTTFFRFYWWWNGNWFTEIHDNFEFCIRSWYRQKVSKNKENIYEKGL